MTICAPSVNDGQTLFGEVLANKGDVSVTVTRVSAHTPMAATIDYLIDVEGPALDQLLGTGVLDPAQPDGLEAPIIDRATPAEGATIPAATSASLIILVSPDPNQGNVDITKVTVDYEVEGKTYREQILVKYIVAVESAC